MVQNLHKNIVAIIWRNRYNRVGRGSGVLISKDLVLTCAHNFYYEEKRVEDILFSIYPGACGKLERPYKIEKSFIP